MVHCDPGAKPEWVEKILMDAVMSAKGVLPRPAPLVQFEGVKEWSAEYAVRFFCPTYLDSIPLEAAVWRDIIRNLRYAGFESVIHEEFTLFHLGETARKSGDMAPMLINDVEVFEPFGAQEKAHLCQTMARHRLEPDRTVIEQGDDGDSLFIVAEGALKVEIWVDDETEIEVGRLGPGDFFGEMALLTGEVRGATVTTLTPTQVNEIAKKDIEPIIHAYPGIAEDL
ncbi:MAG: cyclic nucleotide-binding domain-containing protein [Rhodospirillaceae bacterium]